MENKFNGNTHYTWEINMRDEKYNGNKYAR